MIEQHLGLVYWTAKRLGRQFGRNPQEFVGSLVLHFDECLKSFDPAKGKITDYFLKNIAQKVVRKFIRRESEGASLRYHARYSRARIKADEPAKAATLNEFTEIITSGSTEREGYIDDLLSRFSDPTAFWQFVTRRLSSREKVLIEQRFLHTRTLQEVGEMIGCTKQRVQQLEKQALQTIRESLLATGW